jgi:sugar lactone lactonase YvrE
MSRLAPILLFIFFYSLTQAQIITPVAGRGLTNKDFSIATELYPGGITFDNDDNAYITDTYHHVIYRVDGKTNVIKVIAGTGTEGYSGDGGPAIHAMVNSPGEIVMDSKGNLIFADTKNNVVRMITSSGYISTIAGNGMDIFLDNSTLATKVALSAVGSLAVDKNDNIYLAGNYRVLKINLETGMIASVAGNGQAGFAGDNGLAIEAVLNAVAGIGCAPNGDLYIADRFNYRLRKISASTGIITTVAGNGTNNMPGAEGVPATSTQLEPSAVSIDAQGTIYVTEASSNRVRKIDNNNIISTVSGKGYAEYSGDFDLAQNAGLYFPDVVAFDNKGDIYITESMHVRKITKSTNIIETFAGQVISYLYTGNGNIATAASLFSPSGLAISEEGDIYISESDRGQIRKIDASSNLISTILSGIFSPTQLIFGNQNELFFAEEGNHTIKKLDLGTGEVSVFAGNPSTSGSFGGDEGLAISANFWNPRGMAFDNDGNLIICDLGNHIVRQVDKTTGIVTTIAGTAMNGGYTGDDGPATSAKLNVPRGVAIDMNGDIYISDSENHVIRKIANDTGIITTFAGSGEAGYSGDGGLATSAKMVFPEQLAIDNESNILYCVEYGNHVIRKIDLNTKIITTFAGTGLGGYSGDFGPATTATFYLPRGIVLDKDGNVYISDENGTVRKVQRCLESITQPSTDMQVYCLGEEGQPLSVDVTGEGSFTYQWYSNLSPSNFGGTKIMGATLPTYAPNLPQGNWYYAEITGSCGTFNSSVSGLITGISIPKPTIMAEDESSLLISSSATSYQWYIDGLPITGASEKHLEPNTTGRYSVKTLEGLCESEMSDAIDFVVTGLNEGFPVVEVYPNPVSDYLNINTRISGLAQISALTGAIVWKANLTGQPFQINVSGLANGLYLLKIPGSTKIFKFVKH